MTTNRRSELADRMFADVNGDRYQRAATQLLCTAAGGIWLSKLDGWPEYLRALEEDRHPDALRVDWHQLREDLAADDHAWSTFNDWPYSAPHDPRQGRSTRPTWPPPFDTGSGTAPAAASSSPAHRP